MALQVGVLEPEESHQLGALTAQAFRFPSDRWSLFLARLGGHQAARVVRDGRRVVGGLSLYRMGQYFGGRSVPMWGVAAVAVDPTDRGRGVGRTLMHAIVREMADQGVALSALYPATVSLYRGAGYEYAGNRFRWTLDLDRIRLADRPLEVRSIDVDDPAIRRVYAERAAVGAGNLDRHEAVWQRIVDASDAPLYAYGAYRGDALEGYVLYRHEGRSDPHYDVTVRDFVAVGGDAARTLWSLLRDSWTMGRELSWHGPATDPLVAHLPHNVWRLDSQLRWMLRICSVPLALQARGWPRALETELHLRVDDPLVPQNAGDWLVQIADGKAQVRSGGRGALRLGIQGLATLYSGLHDARTLRAAGWLDGEDAQIERAALAFAGPEPWIPDMF